MDVISYILGSNSYASGIWRSSQATPDHHPYPISINGKYSVINHATAAAAAANFAAASSPYHFHQRNSNGKNTKDWLIELVSVFRENQVMKFIVHRL